ncbi:hypothetical protein ACMD2_18257 [Ananas comosus]|uniref:Uncharacterized protein n=1 Tax=Ananas comosus TaxID=4615 RepID=A0A199W9I9_ANACO|nr:hypothetical protein ACMD2_18257 [Ananas comosus]
MAMASSSTLTAYRVLFTALGLFMLATLVYTLVTDGSPFRRELLTPWMSATLVDFYVNVVAISVWVIYKESSWISSVIWIVLLVCFGSIATCAYIVKKLYEVSSQGLAQDPLDLLLLRNDQTQKRFSFVVFGRILFSILGVFMVAVISYTIITDGLPFRMELLTPWMAATLIDFYINVVAISVWIAHKESTWIGALFWICLLICFGSITTCFYIVIQLLRLSPQEPIYNVLLDFNSKYGKSTPSK